MHPSGDGIPWTMPSNIRVLDAARSVVDEVNRLIDRSRRRFIEEKQLRESSDSITANIRECLSRERGPDRNRFLRYALGSADETDERLRTNWRASRIPRASYFGLHNRLLAIAKMLKAMMV